MRVMCLLSVAALLALDIEQACAQTPPPGAPPGQRGAQPPGGRRGGGAGRGAVQVMALSTTAWSDGAQIPIRFSQAGAEVSPPLTWSAPPAGTRSFVLIMQDLDAASAGGEGLLHWLVWNIPGTAMGLPEGFPQGPQQPDGTRQISVTGPNYRGPAAPATEPEHHYLFELFAIDTIVDVAPVGASPAATRRAVLEAIQGRIRGKGLLVGRFRRGG